MDDSLEIGDLFARTERLLELFEKAKPEPDIREVVQAILNPVAPELHEIEPVEDMGKIMEECRALLERVEPEIEEQEKSISAIADKRASLEEQRERLSVIAGVRSDLSLATETASTMTFMGTTNDEPALAASLPELAHLATLPLSKTHRFAIIICHKDVLSAVENARRNRLFSLLDMGKLDTSPAETLERIREDRKELDTELEEVKKNIVDFAGDVTAELQIMHDQLAQIRSRLDALLFFRETDYTATLECWVEKGKAEELERLCEDMLGSDYFIYFEDAKVEDDPPIIQQCPGFARPFRTIVRMYSPPKYDEIDPTVLLTITFVLFFGLMLGDAGYGLLLLIPSLIFYRKYREVDEDIAGYCQIGIMLGSATTVIGIFFNSFFGDFIPALVYHDKDLNIFGRSEPFEIGGLSFPFDPLSDPMGLLAISLYVGLGVLVTGLAFGFLNNYSRGDYRRIVSGQLSWALILPAAAILLGNLMIEMEPFASMGDAAVYLAVVMLVVGMLLMFMEEGPMFFFSLTGFAGDWFSFARLMSLGLGTAGLAMAINLLALLFYDMLFPTVWHLVLVPIILLLIVAHLVNLFLQTLGAGVHSLRLEFVELFTKFYSGGGMLFEPFREDRKFTTTNTSNTGISTENRSSGDPPAAARFDLTRSTNSARNSAKPEDI